MEYLDQYWALELSIMVETVYIYTVHYPQMPAGNLRTGGVNYASEKMKPSVVADTWNPALGSSRLAWVIEQTQLTLTKI